MRLRCARRTRLTGGPGRRLPGILGACPTVAMAGPMPPASLLPACDRLCSSGRRCSRVCSSRAARRRWRRCRRSSSLPAAPAPTSAAVRQNSVREPASPGRTRPPGAAVSASALLDLQNTCSGHKTTFPGCLANTHRGTTGRRAAVRRQACLAKRGARPATSHPQCPNSPSSLQVPRTTAVQGLHLCC